MMEPVPPYPRNFSLAEAVVYRKLFVVSAVRQANAQSRRSPVFYGQDFNGGKCCLKLRTELYIFLSWQLDKLSKLCFEDPEPLLHRTSTSKGQLRSRSSMSAPESSASMI